MTATQKIDVAVSNFFSINPNKRLEVIVVLETPQPEVSFVQDTTGRKMPKVAMPSKESIELVKDKVIDDLKKLSIKPVNWLNNANSFVAILTADELEIISKNPSISEIVPNENLAFRRRN